MSKVYFISVLLLCLAPSLWAQWECRSKLGANLKPIGSSNLMWGVEATGSYGYLTESTISNRMLFLGLDYSTNSSTFYVEGGLKHWEKDDLANHIDYKNGRLGLREMFYQYRGKSGSLTTGLQTATLNDHFIVNERILGGYYSNTLGRFDIQLIAGTVSTDFSRNGSFCSTGFLYDLYAKPVYSVIGSDLWDSNLFGLTISTKPGEKQATNNDDDEFSMGGFDDVSTSSKSAFTLNNAGIALYAETGALRPTPIYLSGLFADISVAEQFTIKPEVLLQTSNHNNGIVSVIKAQKDKVWQSNQQTAMQLAYYRFDAVDKGALPLNAFSNILAGEVLRLDASEMPLLLASVKHRFTKVKAHIKWQYAASFSDNKSWECDLQVGKNFGKHFQANLLSGLLAADAITDYNTLFLTRMEVRFSF